MASPEEERRWREGDAALAIVVNAAGEVLVVSRPEPPHEMAIPGGIVEPGEDAEAAARRETLEECGIVAANLSLVCEITSPTDGRKVSILRAAGWSGNAQALEPDTRIGWMTPSELLGQAALYGATVARLIELGAFDVAYPFADLGPSDVHVQGGGRFRRGEPTEPKQMSVLTAKTRKRIPEKYFALPKEKKYPIEDAAHVRDAASRLEAEKNKGAISGAKYREAKRNIARRARQLGVGSKDAPKKSDGARVRIHGELGKGGSIHVRHLSSQNGPRAVGDIVSLSDEAIASCTLAEGAQAPKVWTELGAPGRWPGHPAGDINLTREVFAEIVRNFHADKAKNPNRNIPIDFNHCSEQDPTSGTIPSEGTPAQGWIHDLKLDERGHLWGLVQWGDLARQYIREGKYAGISPAIRFGSKDKATAAPIGARLSSAGLTNQPFLDLAKLVASENQKEATSPAQVSLMSASGYAHGPNEYMPRIRQVFGMHELEPAEKASEHLDSLRERFAACGGDPNGVHQGTSLAKYCFGLRDLVGAAPGAKWDEDVFDVVQDLIDAAIKEHEVEYHAGGSPDGSTTTTSDEGDLGGDAGDFAMTVASEENKVATLLSETQTKLVKATTDVSELTNKLTLSEQTLATTKTAHAAAEAKVVSMTAQFSAMDAELTTLRAKLATQQAALDVIEAEKVTADVTDAIAAYSDTKGAKEELRAQLTEFRKTLPAQFSVMYPKVARANQPLQRNIVAGGNLREPTVARVGTPERPVIDEAALARVIARKDRIELADAQAAVLCMSEQDLARAAKKYMGLEIETVAGA
jgi:ADP-ribose pyrophosphatase YjhB (NUDIX family)